MKVTKSSVSIDVKINGTVVKETPNFKVEVSGTLIISLSNNNIFSIDDEYKDIEQYYFRGDKVDLHKLLVRLKNEGFEDLCKEAEEIKDIPLDDLRYSQKKELKRIYNLKKIIFWEDLLKEEQNLISMDRILLNFDRQKYERRKDICNQKYGFNFEGDNLESELITWEEFMGKFLELKSKYPKLMSFLRN